MFIDDHNTWESRFYDFVALSFEISEYFVMFVFHDTFWLVFIPLSGSLKVCFTVQQVVDISGHIVVSQFIFAFSELTTVMNNLVYTFSLWRVNAFMKVFVWTSLFRLLVLASCTHRHQWVTLTLFSSAISDSILINLNLFFKNSFYIFLSCQITLSALPGLS